MNISSDRWEAIKDKADSISELIELTEKEFEAGDKEKVFFFEANREIIVANATKETLNKLTKVAHLASSAQDNFKFRVRDMDLWNSGLELEEIKSIYREILPEEHPNFMEWLETTKARAHIFSIEREKNHYILQASDPERMDWARQQSEIRERLPVDLSDNKSMIEPGSRNRAKIKKVLLRKGYPVADNYKFKQVDKEIGAGLTTELRDYQQNLLDKAWEQKAAVLANPSGSGKTVTAIALMCRADAPTLILVPKRALIPQWKQEIDDKTTLEPDQIGEYHGDKKEMKDITLATYQIAGRKTHLFREDWGLIIFDEVHHIPSDLYRNTATLQSTRRLGLSATPVREDSREKDIFALIGPEIGSDWAIFFKEDWIIKPNIEIKWARWESDFWRRKYEQASGIQRNIVAGMNPAKERVLEELLAEHPEQAVVIFCDWLDQGQKIARKFSIPFLSGETEDEKREKILQQFRQGERSRIVVSRIGDEGLDLPRAEVGIVVSGLGGSRRQATQRAGRTMRPSGEAKVYFVATKGSVEEDFVRRQMELMKEKGIKIKTSQAETTEVDDDWPETRYADDGARKSQQS